MEDAYSPPTRMASMAGMSKRPSKKWTEQEQLLLLNVVNEQGMEKINWAQVAKSLEGRTGKQCREKWKNDLRPDIFKDPWSRREEYILARLHSEVGNQWAEIAKFLPGRSENSIKNHWNATLRSKAEAKGRTLLGIYGRIVIHDEGKTSFKAFQDALDAYQNIPGVDHIETMQVAEEFFQRRPSNSKSPVRVKIGRSRGAGGGRAAAGSRAQAGGRAAAARKRSRYEVSDSDSLTDCEGDGSFMEDDGEDDASETHVSRRRRSAAAGGSMSRRSSEVASGAVGAAGELGAMAGVQDSSCLGYAYTQMVGAGGRLHGDASATIKLSAPAHLKKGGAMMPHPHHAGLPHQYAYQYAYHHDPRQYNHDPHHAAQYHPHGHYEVPAPNMGIHCHPHMMHGDAMHHIDCSQQMEDGPHVMVGEAECAADWQGVPEIDLNDPQDLGWSPLELEMLREIGDFEDGAATAGEAGANTSQTVTESPGSTAAAPIASGRGAPCMEMMDGGQCSNVAAPEPAQYQGADGQGIVWNMKQEPEDHGPVGCQPAPFDTKASCHADGHPMHHHHHHHARSARPVYMSAPAPPAWVAKGVPAPSDGHYAPQYHLHAYPEEHFQPEYRYHPHHHASTAEPHYGGEQYRMVEQPYEGEHYAPHHLHSHRFAQPHPYRHPHHHQQVHYDHMAGSFPVPAKQYEDMPDSYPAHSKTFDDMPDSYPAPWPAHSAGPVPVPAEAAAAPLAAKTPAPASACADGGPWLGMSPSDYLPGLECGTSPELRGLDDLVAGMV